MNPTQIAALIKQEITKAVTDIADKTYYRGTISAVSGNKANVLIEGGAAPLLDVMAMEPYFPQVGDLVLVLSIGRTGANHLILGRLNGSGSEASFVAGDIKTSMREVAPTGWLLMDNSEISVSTYSRLFNVVGPVGGAGASTTFTADNTTDTMTAVGHTFTNGQYIYMRAGTSMPTGLSANVGYYVVNVGVNVFKVSTTPGGTPVNFTSNGSGTLTAYATFKLPEGRGRVLAAKNSAVTEYQTLGNTFGENMHQMTYDELVSHAHSVYDPGHTHGMPNYYNTPGNIPNNRAGLANGSAISNGTTPPYGSGVGVGIYNAGNSVPFNVKQPTLVVNHFIKY